jgi:hypothetical protein
MTVSGSPGSLRIRLVILIALLVFPVAQVVSLDTDPTLAGEFWVELDPFIRTEETYPLEREEAHTRILEEARYVFSGIIYGYTFVYTPYDSRREVEEIFAIDAAATIPWGDPALTIAETRLQGNLLFALVRYTPADHQLRWIRMMESNIYDNATGTGSSDLFKGAAEKYGAIEEAVKSAIREYLRPRILNKPKEVTGKISLTDGPYIIIDAGEYAAKVSVRIDVDEIVPYRVY